MHQEAEMKTLIEEPRKFGYRQAGRLYVVSKMYEVRYRKDKR